MFAIKKDIKRDRIELTIPCDSILEMLPDRITELIDDAIDADLSGEIKREINAFKGGRIVQYFPLTKPKLGKGIKMDEIKVEGF